MHKTRKEAIEAREKFYLTGKPCKHGHLSKRGTIDASCYECKMEHIRKQRAEINKWFKKGS